MALDFGNERYREGERGSKRNDHNVGFSKGQKDEKGTTILNDVNDARTTTAKKEDIYVCCCLLYCVDCSSLGICGDSRKKQMKSCNTLSTATPWREAQRCLYIN